MRQFDKVQSRTMNAPVADKEDLLVILVDLQPRFVETVRGDVEPMLARIQQLLLMCDTFSIPVLATLEKPVTEKGSVVDCLAKRLPESAVVLPKLSYDLCGEPDIRNALQRLGRKQCAVVGAETDVCVMQSVLGLLNLELEVFLVEDCVMTSSADAAPALARMYGCGAIPITWKSLYYELLQADDEDNCLREDPELRDRGYVPVEDLPD